MNDTTIQPSKSADQITVKLHYYRPDSEYRGWNLWIWGLQIPSCQYNFTRQDGHAVATVILSGHTTGYLSFIPRRSTSDNKWAAQEYGERRVDLSDVVSGTVHCHIDAGQYHTSRTLDADVVLANKLSRVELDYDRNTIEVSSVQPLHDPAACLSLVSSGAPDIHLTQILEQDGVYTLIPDKTLELVSLYRYKVRFEGFDYGIGYTGAYDSRRFIREFVYEGNDFGALYHADATEFALWGPTAELVQVKLYTTGSDREPGAAVLGTHPMTRGEKGVWRVRLPGNLDGIYYTYLVTLCGRTEEVCDPYARTTGVNGKRAMVIDMSATDPDGWETDENPHKDRASTDAVIYELHVRDFSIDESAGVQKKWQGKYLGLTQSGTTSFDGKTVTGLDHLTSLGITHLHLLPIYDYGSVDETTCDSFNWGYDPVNYNVPDGSYATDPYRGHVRVAELKQMVRTLHEKGIGVIMDVVYNHVYEADSFCCNRIVPGYFSRHNPDGSYSDGSGCGNDTASERAMVRKYIVDSVLYWAENYHINGFRFDLVGLLDAQTINRIVRTVHEKHPDVIFYGEGWSMNTAAPEGTVMATQANAAQTPGFAYFSDTIRNLLTGSNGESAGYVSGKSGAEAEVIRNCMARPWFTDDPRQVIQYASCHDNHTLAAKLLLSTGKQRIDRQVLRMNRLTAAIYLTAQGIPFIHAGEEMLRLKVRPDGSFSENSYNAADSVNSIKWNSLENPDLAQTAAYYKGLIALRKAHSLLRLPDAPSITRHMRRADAHQNVVTLLLEDDREQLCLVYNPNHTTAHIPLPSGSWEVCVDDAQAGTACLYTACDRVCVSGISAMVLVQKK